MEILEQATNGSGEFIIKLIVAFGGLAGLIGIILGWNKDRLKLTIDNDSVKRKEVADLLKELYDGLKLEMNQMEINHQKEKKQTKAQYARQIKLLYEMIDKKDIIINELILRLPQEAREVVQKKVRELDHEMRNTKATIQIETDIDALEDEQNSHGNTA